MARRKGVSPIIAELMILAIVVVMGTSIYFAASTSVSGYTSGLGLLFGQNGRAAQEIYVIQYAQFASTSQAVVPVTLTNNQPGPTPAPFQQQIAFNPSTYSAYEASDLGNIRFCADSGCASYLYAWLESCTPSCSPTATSASAWVKLPSAISGAGGTLTVYMTFLSLSTGFDGGYWGEAPQLSATYGQYDNGANVFTQYGGKSWASFTFVGGTWTTASGYLQQTSTSGSYNGGPAALIEGASYSVSGSYVLDTAFSYATQATARVGIVADGTPVAGDTYGYRFIGQQSNNGPGFVSFLNDEVAWVVNRPYQGSTSTPYTMSVADNGGTWSGSLYSGYGTGGAQVASLAATGYTSANKQGATTGYVGISAGYYTGSIVVGDPINVQWFRMRALPPGGVMPSVTVGSLSSSSSSSVYVTIGNVGYVEAQVTSVGLFALTPVGGGHPTSGLYTLTTVPPVSIVSSTASPYCSVSGSMIVIPVSSYCTLSVPFNWYAGASYNLVVATQRGNSVIVQENA